ncbi:MAG: FAD-linked oxidase C-terminal domain-containing protein, partial [Candidatus Paceibacterota bacterium]
FSLLREHIKGKRTAPFIDDIIVRPEFLAEFLPRLQAILDEYNLIYTVAGHAGDGNFHIIPLMDMTDNKNHEVILELSDRVYDLVLQFEGSITAEHNDGIIRTPYLEQMYGADIVALFKEVKHMFDPQNIFNPGKKVGGTKADIKRYLSHK